MIKRINNHLLTHYPLIWNTRLFWMLATNLLLHLIFFISGVSSISAGSIYKYNSVEDVGREDLYVISVLCGLLILIIWLVFYLRNNAFKSFYRLKKSYLAKEFCAIFFILLTSAIYFMSFNWGVRTKVRSFTNETQMQQEMKVVNTAAVYLPQDEGPYFSLNNCDEKAKRKLLIQQNYYSDIEITNFDTAINYSNDIGTTDTTELLRQKNNAAIKIAMRKPGAFSYLNYCDKLVDPYDDSLMPAAYFSSLNRHWLTGGHKDSVRQALQAFYKVLDKYGFNYRLDTDTIISRVFADSLFTVSALINGEEFSDVNGYQIRNKIFLNKYEVRNLFMIIEDSQLTAENLFHRLTEWTITCYTILSLSIFILCYRRFSRKIFLISVVGTIIWAILLGLIALGTRSEGSFIGMLLFLAILFAVTGVVSLSRGGNKTLAGICFNWHAYLVPFILMMIIGLIINYHQSVTYNIPYSVDHEIYMQAHYPISFWVKNHWELIIRINFFVSFLYIAIFLNKWAKRWQAMPEE